MVVVPLEPDVVGWGVADPVVSAAAQGCLAFAAGFWSTRNALRSWACWKEKQYTLGAVTVLISLPWGVSVRPTMLGGGEGRT